MRTIKNAVRFFGVASFNAILLGYATGALAVDHPVTTSGDTFVPATLTINAGDSVTWTGLFGGFHTTTSEDGLWNSTTDGFSFVFTSSGTYGYFCINHVSFGMTGFITVNGTVAPPNTPPTVNITGPAGGNVFAAPANVKIQASASDTDGSVTNVQFMAGATVLGNVAVAPFSLTASNLTAADYILSAIASDNLGALATNSITVHVVNPSPVSMSSPMMASPASFQFSYSADVGLSYIVEVSTNMLTWKPIATNSPATSNPTLFTDPNAAPAGAFYRVSRLPNP